jgi:hypothetical protein
MPQLGRMPHMEHQAADDVSADDTEAGADRVA